MEQRVAHRDLKRTVKTHSRAQFHTTEREKAEARAGRGPTPRRGDSVGFFYTSVEFCARRLDGNGAEREPAVAPLSVILSVGF